MKPALTTATLAALLVTAGCSDSDGGAGSSSPTTTAAAQIVSTTDARDPAAEPTSEPDTPASVTTTPPTSVVSPTTAPRPGVVPVDGSVEDVLADLDDVDNFAALVAGWLELVPGQEGVLRNERGVTLFVPTDAGLPVERVDELLADPDAAAVFIGEHLVVGVVGSDALGGGVTTAMGTSWSATSESIGDRILVQTDVPATNGVIHVIDRPLDG